MERIENITAVFTFRGLINEIVFLKSAKKGQGFS